MSKITIKEPIGLEIDLIEIEDRLPSFKTEVTININHPTGVFRYQANDIWFECSKWDLFVNRTKNLDLESTATLEDMSEQFNLTIEKKSNNEYIVRCSCFEPEAQWGKAKLEFYVSTDSDKVSSIINAFDDFPRWW